MSFNNNSDKIKYEVLEKMEWRSKDFEPGSFIFDTDNSYMRAMIAQGKLKIAE